MNATTNQATVTVTIPLVVNAADLWSETFGSGWEYSDVAIRVKYEDGADWETPGVATIAIHDGDAWVRSQVTVQDLAEAYGKMVAMGWHHCGTGIELGNFDVCVSEGLLQIAVLGEIVFG